MRFGLRRVLAVLAIAMPLAIIGRPAAGDEPPKIEACGRMPAGTERLRLDRHTIEIVGATVYDARQLIALEPSDAALSWGDTCALARRLTEKYHGDGYLLSNARLVRFDRGAARIAVTEGYIDTVEWRGATARHRDLFASYSAKIKAGRPANSRTVERYVLLADDLPGLTVTPQYRRSGTDPAAFALTLDVEEHPVEAVARLEAHGARSKTYWQPVGVATLNNALGLNEALTAAYTGVFGGADPQMAALAYRQTLNSEGLMAFAFANYGRARRPAAGELDAIDYLIDVSVPTRDVEAGLSYPLIRERLRSLVLAGYVFMDDDQSDPLPSLTWQDRLRGFRLRTDAEWTDRFDAFNEVTIGFSQGVLGFGSSGNNNPIASRAIGRADFTKIEALLTRTQPLAHNLSLVVSAYLQYAPTPLLAPEYCDFGGRLFGRGYRPGAITGDHCVEGRTELRYRLPVAGTPFAFAQLFGSLDAAHIITMSPTGDTPGVVNAASVGGGVRLEWSDNYSATLAAAKAVEGPRNDWRTFVALSKRY